MKKSLDEVKVWSLDEPGKKYWVDEMKVCSLDEQDGWKIYS